MIETSQEEWKKVGMDPQFLELKEEEESMEIAQDMIETAMRNTKTS